MAWPKGVSRKGKRGRPVGSKNKLPKEESTVFTKPYEPLYPTLYKDVVADILKSGLGNDEKLKMISYVTLYS